MGDAPARSETAVAGDTGKAAAVAPAPAAAPANAPARPAADSCSLTRALAAWSDRAQAEKRYAVHVAVQLALMEVAPAPGPRPGGAAAPVDTAAASRACKAARERDFNRFAPAYRAINPATVLSEEFVGKLTALGRQYTASGGAAAPAQSPPDSAGQINQAPAPGRTQPNTSIEQRIEVPRRWLATLIAFVALTGVALGYALWRLGRTIKRSERRLHESQYQQQKQFGGDLRVVRDQIESSTRSLQDVENAQKTTRDEVKHYFGLVRNEVATLRDRLAEIGRSAGGSGSSSAASDDSWADGDGGASMLVLDGDPFGNGDWEEATVDVRPADGGPATIHASPLGVFKVRWVHDGAQARLSVNPSLALGAGFRDMLNAAFRCRGERRGTDRYHTVQDAQCTWDPLTGQGRIVRQGMVEEA